MSPRANQPRLPNDSDRTVIVGQSGSGKTQFGAWLLGHMDINLRPWIIFDYKNEEIFNDIENAVYIDYSSKLPEKPGVYILKVLSDEEIDEMSTFLFRVHAVGGIGLYVDEGMVMGHHNKGFKICLTQGRSLKIPMIVLTQRPVGVSSWVFSEAKFWWVFDLQKLGDRKIVADYLPVEEELGKDWNSKLKPYNSFYYDVAKKNLKVFGPVPSHEVIVEAINSKILKPRRIM